MIMPGPLRKLRIFSFAQTLAVTSEMTLAPSRSTGEMIAPPRLASAFGWVADRRLLEQSWLKLPLKAAVMRGGLRLRGSYTGVARRCWSIDC